MAFIETMHFKQRCILVLLALLLTPLVAVGITSPPVDAAFSDLDTSYPDDRYRLRLPNGNFGTANPGAPNSCYISDPNHGDCTAIYPPYPPGFGGSDESHQYVTLSTGNIDDSERDADYPGADSSFFSILSENKGNKPLSLSMVSRAIGTLGCKDYSLELTYINPRVAPPGGGYPTQTLSPSVQPGNTCLKTYTGLSFPASSFAPYYENDRLTGYWKGIIKIRIIKAASGNRQASFHLNTGSAKLGLAGANVKTLEGYRVLPSPGVNWINTYPTNGADDHKVIYTFRPPCSAEPGDQFSLGWDDLDYSTSFQPSQPSVRLVRHGLNPADNRALVQAYTAFPGDSVRFSTITMNSSMFDGAGNPYSFSMEFSGIRGGNGISFSQPFDSTNAKIACTSKTGTQWKLDPDTTVRVQAGAYNPQYSPLKTPPPTVNAQKLANVNRAKNAFDDARFRHFVKELDALRAAQDGEHRWTVQYKTIRAGGGNDPGGPYNKPSPLNSLSGYVAPGGETTLINYSQANTGSPNLKWLFRNVADTEYRNPNPGDGDPATNDGDQYCERLINNAGSNVNGTVVNSPSTWKCVELSPNPPEICEPWTVGAANSVTGDGDPADAWVGENYSFNYSFWKNGPADNTSTIYFYHNVGLSGAFPYPGWTHAQALGSWAPSYGVSIAASQGGTTINDQMIYTPTTSAGADNCGIFGAATLSGSIVVPYYYHLKPTSSGVSDKTQQGDPVTPSLGIDLPAQDNQGDLTGEAAADNEFGGRLHTWSASTNWRIIEFRTSDIDDAKNKIPKNRSGGSGDCAEITSFGIAGFSGCGNVGAGNQVFTIGNANFSYTRPGNIVDPVNTKVCYVGVVGRPTHNAGPAWRYSNVSCTTIVKSPKVQFLNGDLTVGRYRAGDGATATQNCTPPDAGAIIRTAGAPSGASLLPPGENVNHYGSWVEYGAFAKGSITGFGTAAYANSGANNEQKLMFSNDPGTGNYTYPSNCLSNPFAQVEESADVNYIDTMNPENLMLNQFFATAPYDTSAQDKAGYVANNQAGDNPKNVEIEQAPGPAAPLDENFNAFKGRDILIWARKGAAACNTPGAGGNITIKTDINYKKTGYGDISELPRIILLADCKIIIEDNVKRVDAWLIAKDAVETCSAATGQKFASAPFVTHTDCPDQLVINGPVQARRLLLWRTHGSDLTDLTSAKQAAEIFNLRPDQLLATYARGSDAGKPQTIYQTDLPPLY